MDYMVGDIVRFCIAAAFIVFGIFIYAVATFGIFKFKYVLNRMHIAAQSDTLGLLSCLIGVMILTGISWTTLKLALVILFFWIASPLTSHLVARAELSAHASDDQDQFEIHDFDEKADVEKEYREYKRSGADSEFEDRLDDNLAGS